MVKTLFLIIVTAFSIMLLGETALVVKSVSDGSWATNVPNIVEVCVGWLVVLGGFIATMVGVAKRRIPW